MITNTILFKSPGYQNILSAGIRMLELWKLSSKANKCKKEEVGLVSYIQNSIEEGDTVLDIGSKEGNYIYFMRRKLKQSGKIIAFESQPYLHRQLFQLKKLMNWKNVETELMRLSNISGTIPVYYTQNKRSSNEAIIININQNISNVTGNIPMQTLDNYCASQNIKPRFLKIDADGNELKILMGAINTLKNCKPKILVKCEERIAGAEKVMETFRLLKQLDYAGYFILDTMRIPLVNFDFNVYQNPCKNFYCSNFLFE